MGIAEMMRAAVAELAPPHLGGIMVCWRTSNILPYQIGNLSGTIFLSIASEAAAFAPFTLLLKKADDRFKEKGLRS